MRKPHVYRYTKLLLRKLNAVIRTGNLFIQEAKFPSHFQTHFSPIFYVATYISVIHMNMCIKVSKGQ